MGGRGASGSTAAGTSVRARNVVSVIARLRGRVAGRAGGGLVVDVNGVGYLVHAAPSVQRLGGGEITIEIHTIVREDALQLYGFASSEERELFELLLGVSGVGPKVALAIVSGSTPAELRRAIARDDVKRFQAIPGVGLKTAQRVVLDLKEKLSVVDALAPDADDATLARDALVNLGWSLLDAERVLASVDAALPVEEQVREALRAAA
jgi:Holliday junction DNA helicase RuvA